MSTTRKTAPSTTKTIVLVATLCAGACAIVALALVDPPADTEIANVSFDVAPPAATAQREEPQPSPMLLSAVGRGRSLPARTPNDPWSADESSGGTRPDAMH